MSYYCSFLVCIPSYILPDNTSHFTQKRSAHLREGLLKWVQGVTHPGGNTNRTWLTQLQPRNNIQRALLIRYPKNARAYWWQQNHWIVVSWDGAYYALRLEYCNSWSTYCGKSYLETGVLQQLKQLLSWEVIPWDWSTATMIEVATVLGSRLRVAVHMKQCPSAVYSSAFAKTWLSQGTCSSVIPWNQASQVTNAIAKTIKTVTCDTVVARY